MFYIRDRKFSRETYSPASNNSRIIRNFEIYCCGKTCKDVSLFRSLRARARERFFVAKTENGIARPFDLRGIE